MVDLSDGKQLSIDCQGMDDVVVLALVGELDIATRPIFDTQIQELEEAGFERLLLDLRGLSFMDSTGLGVIIAADQRARRSGARVEVLCASGQVRRVFSLAGLDELLAPSAPPDGRAVPRQRSAT